MANLVDAAVFFDQGSSQITVQSSGRIALEGGASITLPSSAEAEGTNMTPSGMSIITGSSSDTYTLPAPIAGVDKYLLFKGVSTGVTLTINTVSGTFAGTGGTSTELICGSTASTGDDQIAHLFGQTTALWSIVNKSSGIVYV